MLEGMDVSFNVLDTNKDNKVSLDEWEMYLWLSICWLGIHQDAACIAPSSHKLHPVYSAVGIFAPCRRLRFCFSGVGCRCGVPILPHRCAGILILCTRTARRTNLLRPCLMLLERFAPTFPRMIANTHTWTWIFHLGPPRSQDD